MEKSVLCIDVGGSHISSALVKIYNDDMNIMNYVRTPVNSMADKELILSQWKDGIYNSFNVSTPIDMIFVSIPGPFDYEKGISLMDGMNKYQSLLNMDLKVFFSDLCNVPKESIYFYNDALAFLLGEIFHYDLYHSKVVGLTLGTGLGSAIFENGKCNDLNYGSAPFREGISEDYISTRGMLKYINESFGTNLHEVIQLVDTDRFQLEKKYAFNFLRDSLIEFILLYIVPQKPDYIILGGSIAKSHDLFYEDLQNSINIPIKIASMNECNLFLGMISNTTKLN